MFDFAVGYVGVFPEVGVPQFCSNVIAAREFFCRSMLFVRQVELECLVWLE